MIVARRDTDVAACVNALHESHLVDAYPMSWPADPVAWLNPGQLLGAWIARVDPEVAGHIALVTGRPGWASVKRLFVRPSHQRNGLAVALLDVALDNAEQRGLTVELDVVEESGTAIRLYERLGWTLIAREPAPFTWADGNRPTQRRYIAPSRRARQAPS
jgi:GNAT superfamily N-acetyltransferase